jgi:maleylacetoacetate isomerase
MSQPVFDLYNFFNSSAAYRVRIALGLKKLQWRHIGVNLRAGEQNTEAYVKLNSNRLVPVLTDSSQRITQSLAIVDYLDRIQPEPLLVPRDGPMRTRVLEIALTIACDMHPLNNMRVQKYLSGTLRLTNVQKSTWVDHWLTAGFTALEQSLPDRDGWSVGDSPTLADCCIVPQVANAMRASYSLAHFPRVQRVFDYCQQHPAFQAAAPSVQPDFVSH